MGDPALCTKTGDPLGSRLIQYFEKCYVQNLTIICRAKGWEVDGCGNSDRNLRYTDYFVPNREANRALVSGPCFAHGGAQVEVSNKLVEQWANPDT